MSKEPSPPSTVGPWVTGSRRGADCARGSPDFLTLPSRVDKPRSTGLTHVLDAGLSVVELESLLLTAGSLIDIVKFGWGTAYISGSTREKITLCHQADVHTCLGGTLLEIAESQGKIDQCLTWTRELGVDCLEVSNGALEMSAQRKRALIRELSQEFIVLSEVGSKQPGTPVAHDWITEMTEDLRAGASWVITEGRESGTVGLFDARGAIRRDLLDEILQEVGDENVIFEAPRRAQQSWLTMHVGTNVSLGNVAIRDVVSLETLRLGLRADTIALSCGPGGSPQEG